MNCEDLAINLRMFSWPAHKPLKLSADVSFLRIRASSALNYPGRETHLHKLYAITAVRLLNRLGKFDVGRRLSSLSKLTHAHPERLFR